MTRKLKYVNNCLRAHAFESAAPVALLLKFPTSLPFLFFKPLLHCQIKALQKYTTNIKPPEYILSAFQRT